MMMSETSRTVWQGPEVRALVEQYRDLEKKRAQAEAQLQAAEAALDAAAAEGDLAAAEQAAIRAEAARRLAQATAAACERKQQELVDSIPAVIRTALEAANERLTEALAKRHTEARKHLDRALQAIGRRPGSLPLAVLYLPAGGADDPDPVRCAPPVDDFGEVFESNELFELRCVRSDLQALRAIQTPRYETLGQDLRARFVQVAQNGGGHA